MLSSFLSSKVVLVIATFVGMAMCSAGIGQVAASSQWLHPLAIIGYILGALILVVVGAGLFGYKLPLIDSTQAALIAMIVLVIVKVAITQIHRGIG